MLSSQRMREALDTKVENLHLPSCCWSLIDNKWLVNTCFLVQKEIIDILALHLWPFPHRLFWKSIYIHCIDEHSMFQYMRSYSVFIHHFQLHWVGLVIRLIKRYRKYAFCSRDRSDDQSSECERKQVLNSYVVLLRIFDWHKIDHLNIQKRWIELKFFEKFTSNEIHSHRYDSPSFPREVLPR